MGGLFLYSTLLKIAITQILIRINGEILYKDYFKNYFL